MFRLSVDAYHRMIEAGVFGEDGRVELIDGELRALPPVKSDHAGQTTRLNRLLILGGSEVITPALLPGLRIPVADI